MWRLNHFSSECVRIAAVSLLCQLTSVTPSPLWGVAVASRAINANLLDDRTHLLSLTSRVRGRIQNVVGYRILECDEIKSFVDSY
jgi:hypothetical protein